ncbi:MAG: GTP 3',8-cyclase MoaA [Syntrophales bacterium]|nr:GTP 3',8-cyclase MoaA [Syntrophales bacterium]
MLDKYDRDINYLRISVTDRCNLRCVYCTPREGRSLLGHDDILRYEEILRVIRVAVKMGVVKVRVTGGEPLVRRSIVDFIASLKTIKGIDDISLTTNGILLEAFAERLFNAGMKRINISLDSLNASKYTRITRGGDLDAVLRGIDEVYRVGFLPIKINTVAIKGFNDDEVLDFARLTLYKPYQIRFIELMPIGEAGMENNGRYLSNDIIRERINRLYRLEPVNGNQEPEVGGQGLPLSGPARMYRITGGVGEIGFISPVSRQFCLSCNRLRLTADGHLRACLLSDEEVDLKGPLQDGCSDVELEGLIKRVIAGKPVQYSMACNENHIKKCMREMSSIGG